MATLAASKRLQPVIPAYSSTGSYTVAGEENMPSLQPLPAAGGYYQKAATLFRIPAVEATRPSRLPPLRKRQCQSENTESLPRSVAMKRNLCNKLAAALNDSYRSSILRNTCAALRSCKARRAAAAWTQACWRPTCEEEDYERRKCNRRKLWRRRK